MKVWRIVGVFIQVYLISCDFYIKLFFSRYKNTPIFSLKGLSNRLCVNLRIDTSLFEIFHDHCLSEVLEAGRSWPVLESSDDEEIDIYTLAGIYRL